MVDIDSIMRWFPPNKDNNPRLFKWYWIGFTEGLVGALAVYVCLGVLPPLLISLLENHNVFVIQLLGLFLSYLFPYLVLLLVNLVVNRKRLGNNTAKWWENGFIPGTLIAFVVAGIFLFYAFKAGKILDIVEMIEYVGIIFFHLVFYSLQRRGKSEDGIELTGVPNEVLPKLERFLEENISKDQELKIVRTNNPKRMLGRNEEYEWEKMVVIYQTDSKRNVEKVKDKLNLFAIDKYPKCTPNDGGKQDGEAPYFVGVLL